MDRPHQNSSKLNEIQLISTQFSHTNDVFTKFDPKYHNTYLPTLTVNTLCYTIQTYPRAPDFCMATIQQLSSNAITCQLVQISFFWSPCLFRF